MRYYAIWYCGSRICGGDSLGVTIEKVKDLLRDGYSTPNKLEIRLVTENS